MRISDWSSDVCSSDLRAVHRRRGRRRDGHQQGQGQRRCHEASRLPRSARLARCAPQAPLARLHRRVRHAWSRVQGDRKSVVEGKEVLVSGNFGGRRVLKKKKKRNMNKEKRSTK